MSATRIDAAAARLMAGEDAAAEFLEAVALARLLVPLDAGAEPEAGLAAALVLPLGLGPTAVAFEGEPRFLAFIDGPTAHIALPGAALAEALAPRGLHLALNPGAGAGEALLTPDQLAWIAETLGSAVSATAPEAADLCLPPAPEEALLSALAARIADLGPAIEAAWLTGLGATAPRETVLILVLSPEAAPISADIAAELTRTGQLRSAAPFATSIARTGGPLAAAAARVGIGLTPEGR